MAACMRVQMSKERLEARELVRSINVLQYIGERHNWMIIVAPETPVAGEECIILFNRLQSEALRCGSSRPAYSSPWACSTGRQHRGQMGWAKRLRAQPLWEPHAGHPKASEGGALLCCCV